MMKINLQFFGGRGSGSYSGNSRAGSLAPSGDGGGTDLNVAGWTPQAGSKSVNEDVTMNGAEKRILNLDHEQLVVVDKYGYVVSVVDGSEHSVGITDKAAKAIAAGGRVTHNHPNGGTFSPADVISAGNLGATEIRAASKRFKTTYSLKATNKANGKGIAKQMNKDYPKIEKEWDAKILKLNNRKYMNKDNYEKAVYQAYNDVMDAWMKKNASKYGYTYSSSKL